MKKINKLIEKMLHNDKIMYIIVGGCTTLVNLVVFGLLEYMKVLNTDINNVISISCAIIFAFFTNKIFVFKSKSENKKEWFQEFWKFVSARLSTMVIEVGGVKLLYDGLGIDSMIAKAATQVIVLIVNYFISKFIVFKVKKTKNSAEI